MTKGDHEDLSFVVVESAVLSASNYHNIPWLPLRILHTAGLAIRREDFLLFE